MARIDTAYVDALNNYSKSLEKIVEILQQQVNNRDTDVLETMARNMGDNLGKIVQDLEEVNQATKRIDSKTDKILQEIKDLKKQKEAGMFGQVSDPANKNKIIDGIKIITLIAGGVLAIGLAFKIIGHVDIFSVIALGISISLMAVTFSFINEKFKNLTFGRAIVLTGMLLVMSMGIMMSSRILQFTAPMTAKTMLSVGFTALILGSSLLILTKSLEKIKFGLRTIFGLMLLPFLAPIVSMAIVTSSHILKNAATLGLKQVLSVTFTSIALGIALYAITTAVSKMNMKSSVITMLTKGAVFGAIIVSVAGGIVLGSLLLSKVTPISLMQGLTAIFTAVTLGIVLYAVSKVIEFTDGISIVKALAVGALMLVAAWAIKKSSEILSTITPFSFTFGLGLLITSFAIGLSLLAFVPAWKMFGKSWFSKATAITTSFNILMVAATIVGTSIILSAGNYDGNRPNYEWSFQVGLSLVVFGGAMMAIGKLDKTGAAIQQGGLSVLGISAIILATSIILGLGTYDKSPPIEWITNVGISLVLFGGSMLLIGKIDPSGSMILQGGLGVLGISVIIMATSFILSVGTYNKYPSIDWIKGVGISLVAFGAVVIGFGLLMGGTGGLGYAALALGIVAILGVAVAITATSYILGKGNYSVYPPLGWVSSVGLAVTAFGLMGPLALLASIFTVPILIVAATIAATSYILGKGEYKKGPSLDWSMGTGMLMVAFSTSAIALGVLAMTGIGAIAILSGLGLMLLVAKTIKDVSKILSTGTYTGGPTFDWAEGVGTAIMAFASAISSMGLATGGLKSFFVGVDVNQMKQSISAVVDGMVEANKKLGGVSWSGNYPTKEWAEGVGTSVSKFAEAARSLRGGLFSKNLTSSFVSMVGTLMDGLIAAASKMQGSKINWNGLPYPKTEWVTNIGSAIETFLDLSRSMRGGWFKKNITDDFISNIDVLITGLVHIGTKFSTGTASLIKWSTLPYPSSEWIKNIDSAMNSFIMLSRKELSTDNILNLNRMVDTILSIATKFNGKDVFNADASAVINRFSSDLKLLINSIPTKDAVDRLSSLSASITKISGIGLSTSTSIYLLSKSLKSLGETMEDLDMSTFDKLTKFSSSFTAISLIDNLKLQQTIDIIKAKRLDIKAVIDDNSSRFSSVSSTPYFPGNTATINTPYMNTKTLSDPLNDLVSYNKNIDKNIQELLKIQKESSENPESISVSSASRIGSRSS